MFPAEIRCEPPNNKLDRFEGTMTWEGEDFALNNDQIILRGCRLRNTKWCYGIVIFAGRDTKLMQNSGQSKLKRTSIDRMVNKLVLVVRIIFFFTLNHFNFIVVCRKRYGVGWRDGSFLTMKVERSVEEITDNSVWSEI